MKKEKYPILEFDDKSEPVITPEKFVNPINISEHCILVFYQDVIKKLKDKKMVSVVYELGTEMGMNPVYEMEYYGKKIAICHPGVGAPLAAFAMEELRALGCKKFIACGGAGVLRKEMPRNMVIIPNEALRDEGTSYHYISPSRYITIDSDIVNVIESVLKKHKIEYAIGKTWSTDAAFRETKDKVELRKQEGCLTVEMECSAFAAIAQHYNLKFGQLIGAGDDLSGDEWDGRYTDKNLSTREKLFWLSVESCCKL